KLELLGARAVQIHRLAVEEPRHFRGARIGARGARVERARALFVRRLGQRPRALVARGEPDQREGRQDEAAGGERRRGRIGVLGLAHQPLASAHAAVELRTRRGARGAPQASMKPSCSTRTARSALAASIRQETLISLVLIAWMLMEASASR